MKQKRISIQIDPRLYTAAQIVGKRRDCLVGEVIENALRQHEEVQLALRALDFVETSSLQHEGERNSPNQQGGGEDS